MLFQRVERLRPGFATMNIRAVGEVQSVFQLHAGELSTGSANGREDFRKSPAKARRRRSKDKYFVPFAPSRTFLSFLFYSCEFREPTPGFVSLTFDVGARNSAKGRGIGLRKIARSGQSPLLPRPE